MWRELEADSGEELMKLCGLVLAGPANGEAVPGVLLAKKRYDVPIAEIDHATAAEAFPTIRFNEQHTILTEQDAGYLRVDDCVRTHLSRAQELGAIARGNERVVSWTSSADGVEVTTNVGTYSAAKLIVSAGAWSEDLLPQVSLGLKILRKPVFWFDDVSPTPRTWPVFYIEDANLSFYGLPGLVPGQIKLAEHSRGVEVVDPTNLDRDLSAADTEPVMTFAANSLRDTSAEPTHGSICMYSMSRDGHFCVGRHPRFNNVVLAAGFSGHGFKFTPVIAAAVSDLVEYGSTDLPIDFLGLQRDTNV